MLAALYLYYSGAVPLLNGESATVPAVVVGVLLAIITLIAQLGRAEGARRGGTTSVATKGTGSIGRMRAIWRRMCSARVRVRFAARPGRGARDHQFHRAARD